MFGLDVGPNGPSAEAWAFFSVITAGIFTIIGQQLKARHDAKLAKVNAAMAAKNAEQAVKNTETMGNGFSDRMDNKLNGISEQIHELDKDFRDHLEWHVNNPSQKKGRFP